MIRWVCCFLLWTNSAAACEAIGQPMTSDAEGAPAVYVEADDIPLAQLFSVRIKLCDGKVVDELRVDAIMPAHQHGMNYTPTVTALGENLFEVDGMLFHMPGLWELQAGVTVGGREVIYTHAMMLK